jgi:hypothetical protein
MRASAGVSESSSFSSSPSVRRGRTKDKGRKQAAGVSLVPPGNGGRRTKGDDDDEDEDEDEDGNC